MSTNLESRARRAVKHYLTVKIFNVILPPTNRPWRINRLAISRRIGTAFSRLVTTIRSSGRVRRARRMVASSAPGRSTHNQDLNNQFLDRSQPKTLLPFFRAYLDQRFGRHEKLKVYKQGKPPYLIPTDQWLESQLARGISSSEIERQFYRGIQDLS